MEYVQKCKRGKIKSAIVQRDFDDKFVGFNSFQFLCLLREVNDRVDSHTLMEPAIIGKELNKFTFSF